MKQHGETVRRNCAETFSILNGSNGNETWALQLRVTRLNELSVSSTDRMAMKQIAHAVSHSCPRELSVSSTDRMAMKRTRENAHENTN